MNEPYPSDQELAELLSLTMKVDSRGTTIYRNSLGQRHRIHGPAVVWADGEKWWVQNGLLHRTDGPAVEWPNGTNYWFLNDEQLTEQEYNERVKSM